MVPGLAVPMVLLIHTCQGSFVKQNDCKFKSHSKVSVLLVNLPSDIPRWKLKAQGKEFWIPALLTRCPGYNHLEHAVSVLGLWVVRDFICSFKWPVQLYVS